MSPLILMNTLPFFLSTRRTMKFPKKWLLAALVIAVIVAFAYITVTPNRLQQKIDSDVAKVNARFTPSESIDLSMAMKILTHDPPQMMNMCGEPLRRPISSNFCNTVKDIHQ